MEEQEDFIVITHKQKIKQNLSLCYLYLLAIKGSDVDEGLALFLDLDISLSNGKTSSRVEEM